VPLLADTCFRAESAARFLDLQPNRLVRGLQQQIDARSFGMLPDILQGFLNTLVEGRFHHRRQPINAGPLLIADLPARRLYMRDQLPNRR
jgi:hypothetical protein